MEVVLWFSAIFIAAAPSHECNFKRTNESDGFSLSEHRYSFQHQVFMIVYDLKMQLTVHGHIKYIRYALSYTRIINNDQ